MIHPLAITMWDFSWIERRWDGAGFEDWNAALDGVKERGYDAVRIDAFPHLLSQAPEKEWLLLPVWYSNDWGSPYKVRVRLFPAESLPRAPHQGRPQQLVPRRRR